MFDQEASRPFQVTTFQVAQALHDYLSCPIRHDPTKKGYVQRERCPRLVRMVADARSLLERATEYQVVPGLRAEVDQPALPPGWEQTSIFGA